MSAPVLLLTLVTFGFEQATLPPFAPGDPDGLVPTANPKIRYAFLRKVFWKNNIGGVGNYYKSPAPTSAERAAMLQTIDRLTALLASTPTGANGQGFWMLASRSPFGSNERLAPPGIPLARLPHRFSVGYFPFYHEDVQDRTGQWRTSVTGETQSICYEFNLLPGRLNSEVIASEDRGSDIDPLEFFPQPSQIATWQGLPVYGAGTLVLSRPGRPLWLPAQIERVLKASLPKLEADAKTAEDRLADLRKENDYVQSPAYEKEQWDYFEKNNGSLKQSRPSNYETRRNSTIHSIAYNRQVAAAEANPGRDPKGLWYWNPKDALDRARSLIASLDPGSAKQPACWLPAQTGPTAQGRYQMRGDIVPYGSPGCTLIVVNNLSYFDTSLPRTTPQLLTIPEFYRCGAVEAGVYKPSSSWSYRQGDSPAHGCFRHVPIWLELDWKQFSSLVTP